jgi:hypothetical protein
MYSDYRLHKPILAFLPFGFRSVLASLQAEDGFYRPQANAGVAKSTRGDKPKGMQKGGQKSAYEKLFIPYLDNIEITLMKIFAKMPDIALFFRVFLLNGFLSLFGSILNYDRILSGVKQQERSWGVSFLLDVLRKVV